MDLSFDFSSLTADAGVDEAAFRALLETPPPRPGFAESRWPFEGVTGREVSGVEVGVTSVEVVALVGFFWLESRPGIGGGGASLPPSKSEGELSVSWTICGAL